MAKNKNLNLNKPEVEAEEPKKVWQSFKVKKEFPTTDENGITKVYQVGENFKHYDKRVINFLKTQNII